MSAPRGRRRRRGDRRQPPHHAAVDRPALQISFVARGLMAGCARELVESGFDRRAYVVLNVVEAVSGLHQQGIAERTGLDRTTLGNLLADLEHDALVVRDQDALDRRALRVSPTSQTRGALEEMATAIERAENDCLRPLTAKQRRSFEANLARLVPPRLTAIESALADLWG